MPGEVSLLYFFSWNFIWFLQKEPTTVQNFRLSTAQVKFHQICTLIGYFCWKCIKFQLKKVWRSYVSLYQRAIVCTPLPFLKGRGGGGWASNQIFKKRGLDKISTFREELLGKRRVTFFKGDCNFHIKNKLKSEIFNDKKCLSAKIFFSIITQNSNWEILPEN